MEYNHLKGGIPNLLEKLIELRQIQDTLKETIANTGSSLFNLIKILQGKVALLMQEQYDMEKLGTVLAMMIRVYHRIIAGLLIALSLCIITIGGFVYLMLSHLHENYHSELDGATPGIVATAYVGRKIEQQLSEARSCINAVFSTL